MHNSILQAQATLHLINTLCDIVDDTLCESTDPHVVAVKDLFNYIWSELQKTEDILHNAIEE